MAKHGNRGVSSICGSADVIKALGGEKGPRQDVVLLNASAALIAGGMAKDFKDGIEIAGQSIESGKAKEKLEKLIEFTNK